MGTEIKNLEPKALWSHFYNLTQIPRPSKKEQKAAEYVEQFGKQLGHDTLVDKAGNVIIRKPATKGMENKATLVLQSHLDMVPQKNSDVKHDFEKDAIQTWIDGEWVKAKNTTLGADNGIGVSAILAVLESKDLKHGPVEGLFTIDEETGMTGAFELQAGVLKGKILLNLDSEDEGELYVGCAGGENAEILFRYDENNIPYECAAYELIIKGLKGGHSGIDIPLGRGNANKLLIRILKHCSRNFGLGINKIHGGNMRNAIPREAIALITIPKEKSAAFEQYINEIEKIIRIELSDTEPDLSIQVSKASAPSHIVDSASQDKIINSIYSCPNGVIRMSTGMPGLVETSNNLAIVSLENGECKITCLLRSSVDSAKQDLAEAIESTFSLAGAKIEFSGGYPGWRPNMNSRILKTMSEVYKNLYGKTPEVKAIHAGLETGIIGGIYPEMDMISFGPTIRHPHSPDEKVNVPTVKKFWDYLVKTLENAPDNN
jgi:dipeptidase D